MNDFKEFGKVQPIGKLYMSITQKIHGTNAQVYIYQDAQGQLQCAAGSRTRWLTVDDDNYGFCRFVEDNKQELIEKLGTGRHYGEWAGLGINSGEGLTEKRLFLFSQWYRGKELPTRTDIVPLLYEGQIDMQAIDFVFNNLKEHGSKIVPGFMRPEGIVINIDGKLYKKVFNPEETQWTKSTNKLRIAKPEKIDVSHLLQPIRLEKLLSRDERYIRDFPTSLQDICRDYTQDLLTEDQVQGTDEERKDILKALGKKIYPFVKQSVIMQSR